MRKLKNIGLLMLVYIFVLTGCKKFWGEHPGSYNDVIWYSSNPIMEFVNNENGDNCGKILVNDEYIDTALIFGPSDFIITKIDSEVGIQSEDEVLIEGTFDFKDGVLKLKIKTDKVYDNKYETITLYHRVSDTADNGKYRKMYDYIALNPSQNDFKPMMLVDAMKSGNILVNPRSSRVADIEKLYYSAI